MENITTIVQRWSTANLSLAELKRKYVLLQNDSIKFSTQNEYRALDLDEIIKSQSTLKSAEENILKKEEELKNHEFAIVDALQNLGVQAGAVVYTMVKGSNGFETPVTVWYHGDGSFGKRYGN